MYARRVPAPPPVQPPDHIELNLTLEEARILRAITSTNLGVPEAVEEFLGWQGFSNKVVRGFLDKAKIELNNAGITVDLMKRGD